MLKPAPWQPSRSQCSRVSLRAAAAELPAKAAPDDDGVLTAHCSTVTEKPGSAGMQKSAAVLLIEAKILEL